MTKHSITISELIEAGVHFGHKTMRWNPKMSSYLYGVKDGVHIIDLQQTLPLMHSALTKIYEVAKNNGKPAPDFKRISDFIWQNTNVKIDWKEIKSGQVPPLLLELEQRPNETIRKYQITSFVEKLPDGSLLIPAMAFKGGEV